MTISGAYGRDYKSAKAAKADWDAGKDFKCCSMNEGPSGTYCSKRDFKEHESIKLRYNNDRSVTMVKGSGINDNI